MFFQLLRTAFLVVNPLGTLKGRRSTQGKKLTVRTPGLSLRTDPWEIGQRVWEIGWGGSVPSGMYEFVTISSYPLEPLAVCGPNKSSSMLQQLLSPADPSISIDCVHTSFSYCRPTLCEEI